MNQQCWTCHASKVKTTQKAAGPLTQALPAAASSFLVLTPPWAGTFQPTEVGGSVSVFICWTDTSRVILETRMCDINRALLLTALPWGDEPVAADCISSAEIGIFFFNSQQVFHFISQGVVFIWVVFLKPLKILSSKKQMEFFFPDIIALIFFLQTSILKWACKAEIKPQFKQSEQTK